MPEAEHDEAANISFAAYFNPHLGEYAKNIYELSRRLAAD